ncbi:MAG: hypothetical protein C4547_09235, partial [Phycisphaerales bacterium]
MWALPVCAQQVIEFTSAGTIACDDLRYEDYDVIVTGATVTIDCTHRFNSLLVRGGGVVTHSAALEEGLELIVAEDVTITQGSSINVSGTGYPAGTGPGAGRDGVNGANGGGGAYAGGGGDGSDTNALGGETYGSIKEPDQLGSGGGNGTPNGGGAGGGRLRLDVGGYLENFGNIRADGGSPRNSRGGGGSGGSIWITAEGLSGVGSITANGASWSDGCCGAGAGGGGRIALYVDDDSFDGRVQAYGGAAWNNLGHGGCGTIYTRSAQKPDGELYIANGTANNMGTEFAVPTEIEGDVVV